MFKIIKVWHKSTCFNCKECHKRLESSNLCEKDKEIYCKCKLIKIVCKVYFNITLLLKFF